jgi:hypothetical protein
MPAPQADAPGRGAGKPRRNAGKRACLIAAYREGLELAAVLLVAGADVLRLVAAGHDGEAVLETAEAVTARWWCRRRSQADCTYARMKLSTHCSGNISQRNFRISCMRALGGGVPTTDLRICKL